MQIATVYLVLDCESNEVADAVNEMLRPLEHSGALVDYGLSDLTIPYNKTAETYVEGDAFRLVK